MENKKVYLLGIGGIAMGNLAGALQDMGYNVVGSDSGLYPPMSDFLTKRNIKVKIPFDTANIEEEQPELVIVGNVIRAQNPEARYTLGKNLAYISMAEAIRKILLKGKQTIVVSGTHGKSTTSSILGWLFEQSGYDPTVFVGGLVNGWSCGYRIGKGSIAVVEGDEYDTAFFDKTPKFLHYNPFAVIITGIEFDHGDIYSDIQSIRREFEKLVSLIPSEGLLVMNREDPYFEKLKKICSSKIITYGYSEKADWKIRDFVPQEKGAECLFEGPRGKFLRVRTSTLGYHNALNCLASIALIDGLGFPTEDFVPHFESFPGLWRRQTILLNSGNITVIDDFAHHPTAVKQTIKAVKKHLKGKKIVAIFEPRTNTSKRRFFQNRYAEVFDEADLVLLKVPQGLENIPENERLNIEELAQAISARGIPSRWFSSPEELLDFLVSFVSKYEVFLFMSNGPMENLPYKLARMLVDYAKEGVTR